MYKKYIRKLVISELNRVIKEYYEIGLIYYNRVLNEEIKENREYFLNEFISNNNLMMDYKNIKNDFIIGRCVYNDIELLNMLSK